LPDSNTRWFAAPKARIALGTAATISALALLPAAVQATPYSVVSCRGGLTKAQATSTDPHYLNYSFHCSANIQSYTVVVNRGLNDFGTIDDFNVAPNVFNDALTEISSTETVDGDHHAGQQHQLLRAEPRNAAGGHRLRLGPGTDRHDRRVLRGHGEQEEAHRRRTRRISLADRHRRHRRRVGTVRSSDRQGLPEAGRRQEEDDDQEAQEDHHQEEVTPAAAGGTTSNHP
jgi:hypothetical protein